MNGQLQAACPTQRVLEDLLFSRVVADKSAIEEHLEHCSDCQRLFEALVDADSIKSLLRGADPSPVKHPAGASTRSNVDANLEATALFEASDTVPLTIGGYTILGKLGRGAFGVVYLAHDAGLDRTVAIKVPRTEALSAAGGVIEFLKEARTLALLDHPHIVHVHEAREDDKGSCYVVSQYIEGRTLADVLTDGVMPARDAARITALLADALQHAHETGIYHRDVKPANILISQDGQPYLADFGLALNDSEIGRGPRSLGTPAYMSPEQARGDGHLVDGRTDIYSLGAVFYKMLTGKRPFMASRMKDLLDLIVSVDPPSVRQRNRNVPEELDRICAKALSRDLSERYGSAGDLARDIQEWLRTTPDDSGRICVSLPGMSRRRMLGRLVTSGAALGIAGAASYILSRSGGSDGRAGRPSSNTLRIGIKQWVGYAPLAVAKEKRLCGGVQLEFVNVLSTSDVGRKVLANKIDCAPYLVDSHALARAEHIPTQAILLLDRSLTADAIVGRPGILDFNGIRKQSVAYVHHEAPHFLLLTLCEKYGVALDQFRHVKVETPAEAVDMFVGGHVDAVVAYEPFLGRCLRKRPESRRLASAADEPGSILDILVAREDYLQSNRPKLRSLIAGWMRGLQLLRRRDPEALAIARQFLGTPEDPVTQADYDSMVRGMTFAGMKENLAFFRPGSGGISEFHSRFDAAQDRWNRSRHLPRRTDPRAADGSEILTEVEELLRSASTHSG